MLDRACVRHTHNSVRKQIKIRPGFTPQEDVRRFRGTRQAQMDQTALPKGHIVGWAPPSAASPKPAAPLSKSAKKNEKRKEKRKEKKDEPVKVKDNWEDEDEDEEKGKDATGEESKAKGVHTAESPNWAAAAETKASTVVKQKAKDSNTHADASAEALVDKLEKLDVS